MRRTSGNMHSAVLQRSTTSCPLDLPGAPDAAFSVEPFIVSFSLQGFPGPRWSVPLSIYHTDARQVRALKKEAKIAQDLYASKGKRGKERISYLIGLFGSPSTKSGISIRYKLGTMTVTGYHASYPATN